MSRKSLSGFRFSEKSHAKLNTCHPDLIVIMESALAISRIDFGISCGHRSVEEQRVMFDNNLSHCDGTLIKSQHNHEPSMAVDIFAFIDREASYDKDTMVYLGGLIVSAARTLLLKGVTSHDIRWGGNWDRDDKVIKDQKFQDLCHFELHY